VAIKVLIVDDEAPARGELRFILETLNPTLILDEARNGGEALTLIEQNPPDVIFLDINMPALNGLSMASLLRNLPDPPLIVFATAYHDHAVKAFELEAFDYIVKPFDEKRLAKTLERIEKSLRGRPVKETTPQPATIAKLWLEQDNENRILVDYSDIYWCEASDKKVYAHTSSGKFAVRYTLKELESLLSGYDFARVHKSHLVNLNHVKEVVPWFSGNYLVRMNDAAQTELSMSRRYAAHLKGLTGWR